MDEQFSAALWDAYSYLSHPYRKNFPLHIHLAIFNAVTPTFECIRRDFPHPETRAHTAMRYRLDLHQGLGRLWEQRLRTVALVLLEDEAFITHPDSLKAFHLAMGKLAAVGELDGCVAMLREVRSRFAGVGSMVTWRGLYDSALRSAVRWLADNSYRRRTVQADIEPVMEVTQGILQEMQAAGVEPEESTTMALLDHARWMVQVSDNDSIRQNYFDILLQILDGGYGVKETSVGWTGLHHGLPDQVKLALLDYLGRTKQLWPMIAAHDVLYGDPMERLPEKWRAEQGAVDEKNWGKGVEQGAEKDEMEEDIPTLSKMLEKEREAKAARAKRASWSQRLTGQPSPPPPTPSNTLPSPPPTPSDTQSTTSPPRFFSDYLKPPPTPADIISHSSLPDLVGHVGLRLPHVCHDLRPISGAGPRGYIFKILLHHVWAARREKNQSRLAAVHLFRLALRTAHADQALFIHRLLHRPLKPAKGINWISLPKAPLEPKWFGAMWQIVRWEYMKKRDGREFAPMIRAEVADTVERLEQERALFQVVWERLEQERLENVGKQKKAGSLQNRQNKGVAGEIKGVAGEIEGGKDVQFYLPGRRLDLEEHLRRLESTQQQLQSFLEWVENACGASTERNWRRDYRRAMRRSLSESWDDDGGDEDFGQVQERWYVEELKWYYRMADTENHMSPAFP
ncbi:hypothetical protein IAT38_003172 [Cryptococcus sp. DSM 104549]